MKELKTRSELNNELERIRRHNESITALMILTLQQLEIAIDNACASKDLESARKELENGREYLKQIYAQAHNLIKKFERNANER